MSKSASVGQSAAAEKFRVKRSFTDEFKQSAVRLVVAEGYSFAAAAKAVNVGEQSLRRIKGDITDYCGSYARGRDRGS
jgi:transposase-like protein